MIPDSLSRAFTRASTALLLFMLVSLPGTSASAQSGKGPLLRAGGGTTEGAPASCGPAEAGATCDVPGLAARNSGTAILTGAGNPINLITGNKYQREVDLPPLPGVLGLELVRHYNSALSGPGHANGTIGRGWRLSYDTDLFVRGNSLHLLQADGSRLIFDCDPGNPNTCVGDDPSRGWITIRAAADGPEYTWHWPEGRQLLFNPQGRLLQILAPTGEFVTLQRAPNGNLLKVTDPQGRSLQLRYLDREAAARNDRYQGVVAIDTPAGEFRYEYGAEPPTGSRANPHQLLANLVRVHLPAQYDHGKKRHAWTDRGTTVSTVTRHYHYEDPVHPTLLTGISVDGAGSDGKVMRERISTYAYDAAGRGILSVKGEPLKRDDQGKLVRGTGAEQVTFDRSRPGTTLLTNSSGEKTRYKYAIIAGEFRLTEVRGAGCESCGETNVRYGYDKVGRLVGVTRLDGEGNSLETMRYELDGQGRKRRIERVRHSNGKAGPAELLTEYEYPSGHGTHAYPVSISRPSTVPGKQYQVRISYNDLGQPIRMVEAGWTPAIGATSPAQIERGTSFEYVHVNGRSLLAAVRQDDSGQDALIRLEYDQRGSYPVRITTADGETTDILGRTADGRPSKVQTSDGKRITVITTDYLPGGQVKRVTQTAPAGSAGQPAAERKLDVQYDALARLTELRLPAQVLRFIPGHDSTRAKAATEVSTTGDAERTQLLFGTGAAGSAAEREVIEVAFNHGSDAEPLASRWLDDFGRLVALQYRGQGIARARYIGGGNRIRSVIDGAGNETRLQYDRQGKLHRLERFDTDGVRREWTEYKHEGRLLIEQARYKLTDKTGPESVIRRTYDAFGQVIREYQQSGGHAYTVNHEYDTAGRASRTWIAEQPGNGRMNELPAIRFRYRSGDQANQPEAIEAESGWFGSRSVATAIEWMTPPLASAGQITPDSTTAVAKSWRLGNGLSVRGDYRYSQEGSPWRLSAHHDGVHEYKIASDPTGRIVGSTQERQPRVGNQEQASQAEGSRTATAETSSNPVVSHQSAPDIHAASGERDLAGRERTFRHGEQEYQVIWTTAGEIEEIRQGAKLIATYRYDAEGRRISKQVPGQPAANRRFIYSGKQLVAEADDHGRVIRQYITLGWRSVAWLEPARDIGDRIRQFVSGATLVYLHTDHRGAVTAATNDEKKVLWSASPDERGYAEPQDEQSKQFEQPLRLVNQYADIESGLHYNLARYYNPATGRFLSPDPAGFDAGYIDLYAYANGDMLNLVDPDGWATIRYFAIDEGVKAGPNLQPNRGRWAFVIWGIKENEDQVLVYDNGGTFIEDGQTRKLYKGMDSARLQGEFRDHYSKQGFYSPTNFLVEMSDTNAAAIVKRLTGKEPGSKPCTVQLADWLPPIKLGLQGSINPSSADTHEPNRIIPCEEGLTEEEILLRRIQKAIEIHEVKADGITASTDKDCSSERYKHCAAQTWNPAVKSGTKDMQPASYGWIQFTPLAIVDALNSLSQQELSKLEISKTDIDDVEKKIDAVRVWFGRLVKDGKSGKPLDEFVSRGWEQNRRSFERETGLHKENYDRMVAFGKVAESLREANRTYKNVCNDVSPCYWKRWEDEDPGRVQDIMQFATTALGAHKTRLNPYIRNPQNIGEGRAGFQWAAIVGSRGGQQLLSSLSIKEKSDVISRAFLRRKLVQARRILKIGAGHPLSATEQDALVRKVFALHNGSDAYPKKVIPHFAKTFCVNAHERSDRYLRMERLQFK